MEDHFLPRRRYRGVGGWTWSMQRDGQQVTGRGDYFLSTDRSRFVNVGIPETRHDTDHRLILAFLRGEGSLCNRRYQRGRTCWKIRPKSILPQTNGYTAFAVLKGEASITPRPTKAHVYWISQDPWKLADRRTAIPRSKKEIAREVRQARRRFQRALKGDRQKQVREVVEDRKSLMESDQKQEACKHLFNWYRQASGVQAPPSRESLYIIVTKREDLYRCRQPEGIQVPILVTPAGVEEGIPGKEEVAQAVRSLKRARAGVPSGRRVEDLKGWLREASR